MKRSNGSSTITALDYAARSGSVEVLELLLDAMLRRKGRTPTVEEANRLLGLCGLSYTLQCAAQSGKVDLVARLLRAEGYTHEELGQADNRDKWLALLWAIPYAPKTPTGSLELAKLLLDSILARDPTGNYTASDDADLGKVLGSAVFNAASRGYPDMVRLFATTLRDSCGSTPSGESQAFQKLLNEEALSVCHRPRSADCAIVLIEEFGADVSAMDPGNSYVTVLDSAVRFKEQDNTANIKYFLSKGADLHLGRGEIANGPTPLWLAIRCRRLDIARLLLEHGGPVESKDEKLIGQQRLRITAEASPRCPVRVALVSDDEEQSHRGESLILDYEENITMEWFNKLEFRRSDEELANDRTGRPALQPGEQLTQKAIQIQF